MTSGKILNEATFLSTRSVLCMISLGLTFSNSAHYIVGAFKTFDLQTYYCNFRDGFDRTLTEKKLKDECIFEIPTSDDKDKEFKQWCKNQIDNAEERLQRY